ncbi:mRNA-decapping enzyme 1A [Pelodytes ibericus]
MEFRGKSGHDMGLAALRLTDPYISSIVDVTGQVALYSFSPASGDWEKTDIEGTLFVYTRSAAPYHGFTIMNRLSMQNLVEPFNKSLEFQLHEPFLLYKNASSSIYSIWFYDKNDCQRIAKLMTEVVQQESEKENPKKSKAPSTTNTNCGDRSIDILEMLNKARNDYDQGHVLVDQNVSSGAHTANLIKVESVETLEQTNSSQDKSFQAVQKHLTVEELFGTSLSKDQPVPTCSSPETNDFLPPEKKGHGVFLPLSCDHSTPLLPVVINPDSLALSSSTCSHPTCSASVFIPQGAVSQSDSHRMHVLNSSMRSTSATEILSQSAPADSYMMHIVQTGRHLSPIMCQPVSDLGKTTQNHQLLSQFVPINIGKGSSTPHQDADLLHKLKLTPQVDQTHPQPSKATIAPKFNSVVSQLATPESFKGSSVKALNSLVTTPLQASTFVAPATSAASSVLLSPSVFQQSVPKHSNQEAKARVVSPPVQSTSEAPNFVLSRSQLQETLVHLIKNDSSFLSTIHDVYLQSLTKNLNNMKLT